MSLAQFFRILLARRIIILSTLLFAMLVAVALCELLPSKYPATARVLLDVIKPDPVTGQVLSSSFTRGYTKTQTELITDYRVAGDVVDRLGWAKNPTLVADYQQNSDGTSDFRRFMAQRIIDNTDAQLVEGSNILEITYKGGNPILAKNVVTALRSAFIDASLRFRTDAAGRTAEWYVDQASKAQTALAAAEAKKSAFERANGIVMAPGGADSETMKLEQMQSSLLSARSSAGLVGARATSPEVESLKAQLNTIDDSITQAQQKLGTQHPTYIALLERKKVVEQQLAKAQAAAKSTDSGSLGAAAAASAARLESEVAAQKAKVLGLKSQLDELAQMQREVDLRKAQYEKAAARAADLKLEADVSETGLVPLGDAFVTGTPTFPNKPLFLGLGVVAGLGLGAMLAIIVELVSRRIRGPEDLAHAAGAAVLAVIADVAPSRRRRFAGLVRR
ncbi:MAG: exopolysaccharide biosynthesis protein EpsF, partial [Sphingomonadaceae bacterium]|nr:exopolysaccharide biosynthesis protein EpsF [Sphingomonadaceae bacterium]